MRNFVSCHTHIQSLDSGSTPEAFAERELAMGTGYLITTDHGSLAACQKVVALAKKKKLTPIIGLEGYFRDDNCPILTAAGISKVDGKFDKYNKYYHTTLHFMDQKAYETGIKVLSRAEGRAEKHGSERKPLFDWHDMEELGTENITLGSGCLIGMVQRHLHAGEDGERRPDIAMKYYNRLRSIFKPGNMYVELFPHRCDKYWVSGVAVTLEDGERLRYHKGKNFRTNHAEIKGTELAKEFLKGKHETLIGVKHYHAWTELPPKRIVKVELEEGFVQNECTPRAPDGDIQLDANRFMLDMAARYKAPVLVSDDSHFASPDEKIVQDIRLLQGGGNWRFYGSYHRQSSDEAFNYFKTFMGTEQSQFEGWVDNSYEWGSRFKDFKLKERKSLPVSFYPQDTLKHTFELIRQHGRMDWTNKVYVARLRAEIKLLHENGVIDLLPYFFIDEEVCSLYSKNGLLTGPGRGSAAGLLLTYLLGITHVDPLRFGLSMDRFLTVDRIQSGKLPDIDQDLPHRDLLVGPEGNAGWLKERFGDCFAQISVDTTLKVKSAIKDVSRVLHGQVPGEVEALVKKIQMPPQGISDKDFVFGYKGSDETWVKGIIETDPFLQTYVSRYPKEWDIVKKCLGLSRQKGRHACAYVIADEPIQNFIPLTEISNVRVTQYTAPSVEAVGGLKMDFLVVNSLNDISKAISLVQQRSGMKVEDSYTINGKKVPGFRVVPKDGQLHDIWDLPEDQLVFRDICEGDTQTVFQFSQPAAKQGLREFNYVKYTDDAGNAHKALDSIEAIAAFTALDRPGPLDAFVACECHPKNNNQHNMLVEFANRAKGMGAIGSLPILDKLFPETHGVIVYQEQLQKAFQEIGKTTVIEANDFRIHISKKQMAEVIKDKAVFMRGAVETVGLDAANGLWDTMETFGQYGFNKSHAVCYVVIGYACAYMKRHYPLEWWTAVLTNASKDEINEKFWAECGHLIDLPDLRISGKNFEIKNDRIRAPLSLLQGVGATAQEELSKYMTLEKPPETIEDFCMAIQAHKAGNAKLNEKTGKMSAGRSAINRGIIYKLIVSGTMDSFFPPDTDTLEQFRLYEEAKAKVDSIGKKRAKKPKAVDPRFTNLNKMTRFQLRKSILPAYSTKMIPLFENVAAGLSTEGKFPLYKWFDPRDNQSHQLRVATSKLIDIFEHKKPWEKDLRVTMAAPAFVVEDERRTYGAEKKQMAKLTLDIDGTRYTFVKWPDKSGQLPDELAKNLTGSLIMVVITKFVGDKPFSIDDIVPVQPPFTMKEEESAEESAEGQG